MQPKVSIVISAYNYGKYLPKAIDSSLSQDYSDGLEVIVVNDASTDNTDEICKSYGSRIVYLKNQYNIGMARSLNKGISAAKGDYICVLDSDDYFLPQAINWYAKTLDNFPFVGYVYGDFIRVNLIKKTENRHRSPDFDRKILETKNIIYCSSQMYRKSSFKAVGGYDKNIYHTEDWDLGLKMTEKFCALHVPWLIEKRTMKDVGMTQNVLKEGSYGKWTRYALVRMKKRKLKNRIKEIFIPSPLKERQKLMQEEKNKQALSQVSFLLATTQPKKVLVIQSSGGFLAEGFKQKGIGAVKINKEDLGGMISGLNRDFDLIVLWNVLESFSEEQSSNIIAEVIKSGFKEIALLVETKEFYDSVWDRPAKLRAWWIEKFEQSYKTVEPKATRPVITEDNWFYNYGLDKVMFFKKFS